MARKAKPQSTPAEEIDPVEAERAAWESEPVSSPEEIARHAVSLDSPEARAFLSSIRVER